MNNDTMPITAETIRLEVRASITRIQKRIEKVCEEIEALPSKKRIMRRGELQGELTGLEVAKIEISRSIRWSQTP